ALSSHSTIPSKRLTFTLNLSGRMSSEKAKPRPGKPAPLPSCGPGRGSTAHYAYSPTTEYRPSIQSGINLMWQPGQAIVHARAGQLESATHARAKSATTRPVDSSDRSVTQQREAKHPLEGCGDLGHGVVEGNPGIGLHVDAVVREDLVVRGRRPALCDRTQVHGQNLF